MSAAESLCTLLLVMTQGDALPTEPSKHGSARKPGRCVVRFIGWPAMDVARLWATARNWLRTRTGVHGNLVLRLFTGAVFAALGYSLYRNWHDVRGYVCGIRYGYLFLALCVHAIALAFTAMAWHLIIRAFGAHSTLRKDSKVYYYTNLAKRIPGVVWYIGGRAHLYSREGISGSVVVTSVVMETALVFISGVACYLFLSPSYSYWPLPGRSWVLLLPVIPMMAVVLRPTILINVLNAFLRWLGRSQIVMQPPRLRILPICAMYGIAWLGGGLSLYLVIRASYALPARELPTVIGFATVSGLAGLLTLALPAGMGIKEVALAALLSSYVSFPVAVMISLLFRMLTTLDEILWALISLRL